MNLDSRISKLLENWPAKVISLVVAIFIMFLYNLTRLDQRLITVPLNISEGRSYVPATEYPKTVRVTIRGVAIRYTEFAKLISWRASI
jgi:hypothetical protein